MYFLWLLIFLTNYKMYKLVEHHDFYSIKKKVNHYKKFE